MTIIVLINLLIAMMSDTYCRIQEQVIYWINGSPPHQIFSLTSSGSLDWQSWSGTCREPMWLPPRLTSSPPGWFSSGRGTSRSVQNGRRPRWGSGEQCEKRSWRKLLAWGKLQCQSRMRWKSWLDRFVVEENATKKKKQKKPRVIHALGNIKWGFVPANVREHCGSFPIPWPIFVAGHDQGGRGGVSANEMGPRARHQAERECNVWIKRKLSHFPFSPQLKLSGIFGRIPATQQDCSMECSYQAINRKFVRT